LIKTGRSLLEFFSAALGHPRDLRRKALDMLRLAHQQAFGDEQRKIRVDVAGGLETLVELPLQQFPDGVAIRPNHHAPLDRRVVRQFGLADDVKVPA
jgi:hypothetical protein